MDIAANSSGSYNPCVPGTRAGGIFLVGRMRPAIDSVSVSAVAVVVILSMDIVSEMPLLARDSKSRSAKKD